MIRPGGKTIEWIVAPLAAIMVMPLLGACVQSRRSTDGHRRVRTTAVARRSRRLPLRAPRPVHLLHLARAARKSRVLYPLRRARGHAGDAGWPIRSASW